MASKKQELIQLHQLLAEIRFFAKDEQEFDAEIEDLPQYENVGIDSLDLDAAVEEQLRAVLALGDGLVDTLTTVSPPPKPTEKFGTASPSDAGSPTENVTAYDVESGFEAEAVKTRAQAAKTASTAKASTATTLSQYAEADAGVSQENVTLTQRPLLYSWDEVLKTRGDTAESGATEMPPAETESEEIQRAVDVETKAEQFDVGGPETPMDAEQINDQADISTQ